MLLFLHGGNLYGQVLNVTQASVIEGFAGKIPNLTGASAVYVQGNYAYVAGTGDVLQILDITLPGLPVPKGNLYHGTGGASILRVQNIVVRGNYAYMTSYGADAFEIVDVSDPTKPVHKGVLYDGKGSAPYLAGASGLDIVGDYAYVSSANSSALEIIDISNPSDPKHKGSLLAGAGVAPFLTLPVTIFVKDNLAYLGNLGGPSLSLPSKLEIVDISNPALPVHKGDISLGNNQFLEVSYPYGLAISGNYAYVTDYANNALEIIDVSNPALPIHKSMLVDGGGNLDQPFGSGHPPYLIRAWGIHIAGNYAYIGLNGFILDPTGIEKVYGSGALEVVDITNPLAPVHAGAGAFAHETSISRNMHIVGDKAYMPGRATGTLSIVSITDPITPKLVSIAQNGLGGALINTPTAIVVDGNYAYVGNYSDKPINGPPAFEIIDVSDPTRPLHESSLDFTNSGAQLPGTSGIYKKGNYVYTVSSTFHSLQIIDVTVPSVPVKRGFIQSPGVSIPIRGAKSVVVDPTRTVAYVASGSYIDGATQLLTAGSNTISMIQVSNLDVPTFTASLADGGGVAPYLNDPVSVVQSGNYLYVASKESNALEVIQIISSSNIIHAGSLLNGGGSAPYLNEPAGVTIQGKYAYVVSAGSKALEIVDISTPATPVHVGSFIDGQQGASLAGVNSIKVSGNYAYITRSTFKFGAPNVDSGALLVIDVSNPAAPVLADTFADGDGGSLLDNPTSVFISGPYAYIANAGLSQNINIAYLFGPEITGVQPASAPVGSSVTITGENFNTFLTASVNSIPATITNVTATTLTFTVPAGATNGKIGLTLNGQKVLSQSNFLVTPIAFASTDIQQSNFVANWSDVGAAEYFLDLSTDNFNTFVTGFNNRSVGNVTHLGITGLNSGTSYQYRVRSSDGSSTSNNSNTISSVTIPQTPIATAATELSPSGFRVNWTPISGAASYLIDVAYDENFTSFIVGYNNLSLPGTTTAQLVTGLNAYTQCYYRIRSVSAGGSSPYSNSIEALTLDIINPTITIGIPNATTVTLGNTPVLNAFITDNVRVNSAELFYRGISETAFKKATMQGPGGAGGNYSITVQSGWYDALGLEYYFKASDQVGNETVSSTGYMQLVTPSIALPALPSGTSQRDYRIIAFPFQLSPDNKVTTVYSGIPWNDDTQAAMWWWNSSAQDGIGVYDQYGAPNSFQTIDPGKGYWAITNRSFVPQIANVIAPKYNQANLFSVTLKPNWNQVGNPYPIPINWQDVITYNQSRNPSAVFSVLTVYDGSGYVETNQLNAYEGGFVKNLSSSDITIQIPFPGQLSSGRKESISSDISQERWSVFLHIHQTDRTNQLGGFGMHPLALNEQDRYDNFNPPSFLNVPSVSFRDQKKPSATFSKDMVKLNEEFIWEFTPTGMNGQNAQLNWSPDIIASSSRQLLMLDEEQLVVIDMLKAHQYTFTLTNASKFRIFYGNHAEDKITAHKMTVGLPYPNPLITGTPTKINLGLPDRKGVYQVVFYLYNSRGDLLNTSTQLLDPGLHQLELTSVTSLLTSGIYIYKVVVTSDHSSTVYTRKIVKP